LIGFLKVGIMVSQSQEHSQDTRQRLMEAAVVAFAEKGFDSVGIREIAQNAKANPAMIAYHFGNKEGLYEATLKWVALNFFTRFQKNVPDIADPDSHDAKSIALSGLKSYMKESISTLIRCGEEAQQSDLLRAAQKLWIQELQSPRESLLNFIIEQFRLSTDRIFACIKVLRPELTAFEMISMIISIRGPILFFHKNFQLLQKVYGAPFSDDELEKLAQHFINFSLRGMGIPDVLTNEGA
jgi:AcrR family transcriptional regulator